MTNPAWNGNGQGGGQPAAVIPFPGQQQQQGQQQGQQQPMPYIPQSQQPAPQFQQPQFQPAQQPQIVRDSGGISYDSRFMPPVQQPAQQNPQGPQFGQPQQQQHAPVQMGEQTVLDGPGVPAELRGRTWAEMSRIYSGLRDIALRANNQQQIPQPQPIPVQQQQPVPQPQQPVNQWGQPPQQQPAQQPGSFSQADFLRNPADATRTMIQHELQQAFQTVLLPALAPLSAQTNQLGMQSAVSTVAAEVGHARFQAMLPAIHEQLRGVDPRALTNPEMWRIAARSVAGNYALQGQPIPGTQAPQPTFGTPANGYPVQLVQQNPIPNLGGFFSEQPGQAGQNGANGIVLSPAEKQAARAMEMTEADYAAWKGGVVRGS